MTGWTWTDLADLCEELADHFAGLGDDAAAERELALADHCRERAGGDDAARWVAA